MSDFPCLELTALPFGEPAGLRLGTRVALRDGMTLGRDGSGLVLPIRGVSPHHVRLEYRHDRWWALDLGAPAGSLHDGQVLRDAALTHGDTLELPSGLCFAVWFHDPLEDRREALEAEVLAHPDDEGRWLVWADWLLERGLPSGGWIRQGVPDAVAGARALGTLGGAFARGWLDVEWRRGFPRRVVVRAPGPARPGGENPAQLVERVLREPACRFLRALEVDVHSFGSGLRTGEAVTAVLSVLADTGGPPGLEALRLGPLPDVELSSQQAALYAEARRRHSRLTTPVERLLLRASRASLEVLAAPLDVQVRPKPGASAGLVAGEPQLIGQLEECVVMVTAPESHPAASVAVRVEEENGRWLAEDLADRAGAARGERGLRVNGREASFAHLRDGDLLELRDGLLIRFRVR